MLNPISTDDVLKKTRQLLFDRGGELNSRQIKALAEVMVNEVNKRLEEMNRRIENNHSVNS